MEAQRPSIASRLVAAWKRSPEYDVWQDFWIPAKFVGLVVGLVFCFWLFSWGSWDMLRDLFGR